VTKVGGLDDPVWTLTQDEADRVGHPTLRQRVVVITFLVVLAVAVVYPLLAAGLSRKDYGTFAFWKVPNRIDYCGRRYYDAGAQSGNPMPSAARDAPPSARWTFISWTFSGRSIYADVAPRSVVCTGTLYIPVGGGRWESYDLSGGL
jgi:hypothetical protein